MKELIISKEMADTFIWKMKNKGIWYMNEDETERLRKFLESFGLFILNEYDELCEILCEIFKDEIKEKSSHSEINQYHIDGEKALQNEINKMLDSGRA